MTKPTHFHYRCGGRTLVASFLLLAACSTPGPYDRGEYLASPKLRSTSIPLKPGTRFTVRQGAFGESSHSEPGNEFAWDLEVPFGTSVVAADDGTVFHLHQPPGGGGCDPKFSNDAWNVLIEHGDGTVAQYTHVVGSVRVGASVTQGQVIGKTALKGWVCYPHLHFSVFRSKDTLYTSPIRETLPLVFEGITGGLLKKGQSFIAP